MDFEELDAEMMKEKYYRQFVKILLTPALIKFVRLSERDVYILTQAWHRGACLESIAKDLDLTVATIKRLLDRMLYKIQYALAHFASHVDTTTKEAEALEKLKREEPHKDEGEKLLLRPLEDFNISVRAFNGLKAMKIETLAQLVPYSVVDLMAINNFGKKSVIEIQELLISFGLSLAKRPNKSDPGLFHRPIRHFSLSSLTLSILRKYEIETLEDICQLSRRDVLNMRGSSKRILKNIEWVLSNYDLKLKEERNDPTTDAE
ncbi:MAG: hypothetical protein IPP77_03510 [Bacteroidetes bacterium]|nr:hypothetical protein [Bacteroidota bacterium]